MENPTDKNCTCVNDKQLCKNCSPARRAKIVDRMVNRAQSKSRLGPIRRWIVQTSGMGTKKTIQRRLANARQQLEMVTGKRWSKRDTREYLADEGRRMYEKQIAELTKGK